MQHAGRGYSVVDFNRAGVPLMEIVTEPDLRSPAQARAYGETLRALLRAIGASNADMEAGSMRIEGNISLRPAARRRFGTKVEVKNLNSFRSLEHAMAFEAARHADAPRSRRGLGAGDARLGRGGRANDRPAQQGGGERLSLLPRARSAAPPPVRGLGRRAARRASRAAGRAGEGATSTTLGLSDYDAGVLVADDALATYFDQTVAAGAAPKAAANWITGELSRHLNEHAVDGLRADGARPAPVRAGRAHRGGRGRSRVGDDGEIGARDGPSTPGSRRVT